MDAVNRGKGGVFFLYGYGGTGKTFVWKTLAAAIRSKREIVLNVASSGIAALLLEGGLTAHSRFAIPINITETSFCCIRPDSDLAGLIRQTKLIIWDEALMVHKHSFEALDRTFRDNLRSSNPNNMNEPFGGKVVVFGGDFRQVLPVLLNASRQDVVMASLKSSYLWHHCKLLKLTKNMRLTVGESTDLEEIRQFAEWILDIGNGTVNEPNDGEATIELPDDILIKDEGRKPIDSIVDSVYPDISSNMSDPSFFQDKAILAPTHEVVDIINEHVMSKIAGEEKVYLSANSICEDEGSDFNEKLYTQDFLNSIKVSGIPHHRLVLKVGVPVMLLRNIDQPGGLCNGTRLKIRKLGEHVIEAQIISGSNAGKITFIPRMKLIPSDRRIPFRFQRRQFPLSVCFAMTINKSQGQSLAQVGLYLKNPVFSHGQLYVALSRVKSKKGLKVLSLDGDGKPTNTTKNVVFKEVLSNL
uniref:ATP-dependent DNA helicase pif1-like n=1 Tax=Erigeron canadensis TaxID=72917 RepID=UPI001CB8CF1E|nr:ATP-dependent DNA helicase pif1-like [Erigeron canadensis]